MNAKSFHLSVQGASHIKKNKECQDYSLSYQDEDCVIAVVCDGHGGDDYVRSARGAEYGCKIAVPTIRKFIQDTNQEQFFSDPEGGLKRLEGSIIHGWNEFITRDHTKCPFQPEELNRVSERARKKYEDQGRIESAYGTTLIAVAVAIKHGYWFGIHIGDGKCVAVNPEGKFLQPIPWDEKCFLNATTSICDSDAIDRFRCFYHKKLPAAVFIGSDGIDDCFHGNEQLHHFYKTILYSFATTEFEEAEAGLKDYLPRLSAKGSGDDVSIAAILDLDLIPELSIVKEFDREKEKARIEENARREAERNEAERKRIEEEHAKFQQQNNAKASSKQGASQLLCKKCKRPIEAGDKFCRECGEPILRQAAPTRAGVDVSWFGQEPPEGIPSVEDRSVPEDSQAAAEETTVEEVAVEEMAVEEVAVEEVAVEPEPEQPEPEQPEPEQPEPEQPELEQPEPEQPEPEQPEPEQPEPEQPKPEQPEPEQSEPEQPEPEPVQDVVDETEEMPPTEIQETEDEGSNVKQDTDI